MKVRQNESKNMVKKKGQTFQRKSIEQNTFVRNAFVVLLITQGTAASNILELLPSI